MTWEITREQEYEGIAAYPNEGNEMVLWLDCASEYKDSIWLSWPENGASPVRVTLALDSPEISHTTSTTPRDVKGWVDGPWLRIEHKEMFRDLTEGSPTKLTVDAGSLQATYDVSGSRDMYRKACTGE